MAPPNPPDERPAAPRVTNLPPDAPPIDHESLAHIPFPPGFRARRGANWMSIGFLYTSFYMCRYNLPLVNKAICDQFHFTNAQFGIIITAQALAYACGQIINGLITDRIGGKRAMLIGAAGTVVMNALFGAASYMGMLGLFVAIWGINGFVQSYGAPGMVKMNAAWFSRRERGTFAGIFGFMINLGRLIIGRVGPMLLAGFTLLGLLHVAPLHWRWLFWVPSIACAIVAVFMWLIVAETPEQAGYDYVGSRDAEGDSGTQANVGDILKAILPNPAIWVTAGAYACTGAVRQSVDYWFPKYMQVVHNLNLNSEKFYLLVFLIPLVASCGSLMSGVISDRLFQSRRAPVAAALYLIETAIILAAAQFHSANTAILFFVLISFTANSTHSLLGTAAAMDIGGRKMTGFASGMIDSFQYFGGSLAGYALGATIDHFGWGSYFYFMAPFGVIGGVLMITLGDRITAAQHGAQRPPPSRFDVVTPEDIESA
jgi:OPA family glycerol-3-phosphate transporter-like MFS transporter